MTKRQNRNVKISDLFNQSESEFAENLNDLIKQGKQGDSMKVESWTEVQTQFGEALRIALIETKTGTPYSFITSGKIFRKLFEENVQVGDIISIWLNEKGHWRFDFSK